MKKKSGRKTASKRVAKKASRVPKPKIVPMESTALLSTRQQESLIAWCNLYMGVAGKAGADNTIAAKTRDLESFLSFLTISAGVDHLDQWTPSVTTDFLKNLRKEGRSPSTVNRVLATLKHVSGWIGKQRAFLAGNPCESVKEFQIDDPAWKGLKDIEITRLKSAAEQLIHINTRENQQPLRDYAIFLVLLRTGLRISELVAVDFSQYKGKHFVNVQRKGKKVSGKVFIANDAREILDRYVEEIRGKEQGALFQTKAGKRLARQHADRALKMIAAQANATLSDEEKVAISAHVLRHTMLRKAAEKHGVQYAKELSGHASDRYIWRYVQPSDEEKEQALEELF